MVAMIIAYFALLLCDPQQISAFFVEASWKDPQPINQSGSQISSRASSVQSSRANKEIDREGNDKRGSKTSEVKSRTDATSPYSDRSDHSRASNTSLNRRRSSHDLLEFRGIPHNRIGNGMASHDISTYNQAQEKGSSHSKEVEMFRKIAADEPAQRQINSPGRSFGSSRDERYSSSASTSDRKRESSGSIRVEYTNEYVKGSRHFQNFEAERRDRSRSSSLEKQHQPRGLKSVDNEMTTSTPQKTNWPVSPIRRAVDLKVSCIFKG